MCEVGHVKLCYNLYAIKLCNYVQPLECGCCN